MLFLKFIKILSISVVVIFITAFSIPHIVDLNKYSETIIKKISDNIGKKVEVKGGISLSITTNLEITLLNVSIYADNNQNPDLIEAQKVIVYIPILKFLAGERDFANAEIYNAKINLDNAARDLDHIILFNKNIKIKYLAIKDSVFYSKDESNKNIYNKVNFNCDIVEKNLLNLSGDFYFKGEKFTLNTQMQKQDERYVRILNLKLNSQSLNANFQQNKELLKEPNNQGNFKILVKNPHLIIGYLSKIMPFLADMEKRSITSPIDISGYIFYYKNNISAKNIVIKSPHTNGTGNFNLFLDEFNNKQEINFNFDQINLNEFLSFSKVSDFEVSADEIFIDKEEEKIDTSFISANIIKNINASIKITAKKLELQKVDINNFIFEYNSDQGVLKNAVLDFSVEQDNLSSSFTISNLKFDNIADTNILIGEFVNQGNNINKILELFSLNNYINIREDKLNYAFRSKIIFAPKEISIFEIDGNIGDSGKMSGSIATKQEDITSYKVDLKFNNLKLLNFDLPVFESKIKGLLSDSREDRYIAKFVWFRTLSSSYDLKFSFENTELKGNKIDNLTMLCNLSPANLNLMGAIKADFADVNFSLNLTAFSITPTLAVKIEGNKLDYNLLRNIFQNSNTISQATDSESQTKIWDDNPIDVFAIYKFSSNFDINLKFLGFKKYNFDNFKLVAHTAGDSLFIDNFKAAIYGGVFETKGNISFFDKLLYQFSFSASDIEIFDLLKKLSPNIALLKGPLSLAGSIVSEGNSMKDFIANTTLSTNVVASNLTLIGIEPDAVVDLALQREKINKAKVLGVLDHFLTEGYADVIDLSGNLKINNGIVQSNNITFRTRFNSAISALYLNLNNLGFSTNTQFSFLTYNNSKPLSYNVILSGELGSIINKKFDNKNLVKYIKDQYNIVTAEDILEARKASKIQQRRMREVIENPNDQNYLYYKLQEQEIAKKDKEEETQVLKSLTNINNTNNLENDNNAGAQ